MAIIKRKPTSPTSRFQTFVDTSHLTKKKPEKSLSFGVKAGSGRNSYGRITTRHRGGGVKRKYRIIDFTRNIKNVPGKVVAIEYDPNRNANIALIVYANGAKSYILMPEGLKRGSTILAGTDVEANVGNCLPLRNIPIGFNIHNVEIKPGSGGKLIRSAGSAAQLLAKEGDYATLRMPSAEVRMIHLDCLATVGVLGNADYKNITWGKAGRIRRLGIRPTVRGMAMNPVDHPHGGGEGRSKSGKHPVSPWGKGCKGTRTRVRKNPLILRRRKK